VGVVTNASLFNELIKCASDGLLPDGREAAIVPFKQPPSICQCGGVLQKARNSRMIKTMNSFVVKEHDAFEMWRMRMGRTLS